MSKGTHYPTQFTLQFIGSKIIHKLVSRGSLDEETR